ncbi:G:T/U-mismatch repair DNA glycosylase [Paraburkholderia sp. GAS32]
MEDKVARMKTHSEAEKLIEDLRKNQPATVARVCATACWILHQRRRR